MLSILCPICRLDLERGPRTWACAKGHAYDVAREGYVNLLPAHHRNSPNPGDNAEMVLARRRFLEAGHYAPLRDAVVERLRAEPRRSLLDLGCGEGTYTAAFAPLADEVVGVDIAKPAIRLAAKRFREIVWLVASGASLPVTDASVDAITCLFTHLHLDELRRVVRPGGEVLLVTPAADHLWRVREGLFEQVQPHEPDKFLAGFRDGFAPAWRDEVRFDLALTRETLGQLLAMTPYVWKARRERRAALEAQERFETQAAFTLMSFRREG